MKLIPSNILNDKRLLVEATALMATPQGIYTFLAHLTAFISVTLSEACKDDLEQVLKGIATFEEGEVNPNPALTEAMCNYLRLEAEHGRAEKLEAEMNPQ